LKILHCCLAAFYIDDFGYQENILPREHKRLGHEVEVLASTETYDANLTLSYKEASRYLSSDGYWVTRVAYVPWLPKALARKLRLYRDIVQCLARFRPEVIFLHDLQFLSIFAILRHCRKHKVCLYVDTHTDEVNSGRSLASKWILHRIVYRLCARAADKVAVRFWATLPLRATFLSRNYGIAPQRISLLPFGADDGRIGAQDRTSVRASTRRSLGIDDDEFVFVFGGKIDARKNAIRLLRAFAALKAKAPGLRVRLVVFGMPVPAMEAEFRACVVQEGVKHIEWIAAESLFKVFWAADFAIFPGTHSVLWEEAAGLGLPLAVKRWEGITHLDCGGNCRFLERSDEAELLEVMQRIATDRALHATMTEVAMGKATREFSYSAIAARAIDADA
jgi:glycosyltransferase involved in cell wall biosynthesis